MVGGENPVQSGLVKLVSEEQTEFVTVPQLVSVMGKVISSGLSPHKVIIELELSGDIIRCIYDAQLSKRKLNPKRIDEFADRAMDNGSLLFVKGYFVREYRLLNIYGVQEINRNKTGEAYPRNKLVPTGTPIGGLTGLLDYNTFRKPNKWVHC